MKPYRGLIKTVYNIFFPLFDEENITYCFIELFYFKNNIVFLINIIVTVDVLMMLV